MVILIKKLMSAILKWKTLKQLKKDRYSLSSAKELSYQDYLSLAKLQIFPENLIYRNGEILSHVNGIVQTIRPLMKSEITLLKKSNLLFNPHEVFQLMAIDHRGHKHFSKIRHGKKSSYGNQESIYLEIQNFIYALKKKNFEVKQMQIMHTHPSIDMKITSGQKTTIIQNALGYCDINLFKKMSKEWPFKISIKAILPNEISYTFS